LGLKPESKYSKPTSQLILSRMGTLSKVSDIVKATELPSFSLKTLFDKENIGTTIFVGSALFMVSALWWSKGTPDDDTSDRNVVVKDKTARDDDQKLNKKKKRTKKKGSFLDILMATQKF
jgi:hypothetical protein